MCKAIFRGWQSKACVAGAVALLLCGVAYAMAVNGLVIVDGPQSSTAVHDGVAVRRSVYLLNISSRPADVHVYTSCSCTSTNIKHVFLGPLHLSRIEGVVSTAGMSKGSHLKWIVLDVGNGREEWQQEHAIDFQIV